MIENPRQTFIVKPSQGCQGWGIKLIQDFRRVQNSSMSTVCQQYLSPFLLKGFKFDFRIYVLITSVSPLRVYVHKQNMARFCTEKYRPPSEANLRKTFSFLTNYSINKDNEKLQNCNDQDNEQYSNKKIAEIVFDEMKEVGVDIDFLQIEIDNIIRLTLLMIQQEYFNDYKKCVKTQDERSRLFEILGFDIIIDENTKPWLLEVNKNVSLEGGSSFDESLKKSVIKGALEILNLKSDFQQKLLAKEKGKNIRLFDPIEETKIAQRTNWRQLLPLDQSDPNFGFLSGVLNYVRPN